MFLRKGVLCVATCATGFAPLLSVHAPDSSHSLSLSLSFSTPCLRVLHKRRGTWFPCFLIFTRVYIACILDIILSRSRRWSILKENISLRDKTMMPRAVERIMRGKERGWKSCCPSSGDRGERLTRFTLRASLYRDRLRIAWSAVDTVPCAREGL